MKKVLFILNHAPNYRDKYLQELAKEVDLTVMSRKGSEIGLKDPENRIGYKYIELKKYRLLGVNFHLTQFLKVNSNFDVVVFGLSLREPFTLLNLFRRRTKKILFGIINGSSKKKHGLLSHLLFKWAQNKCDAFLVHTDYVKNNIINYTSKPIYSFNNTYFKKSEIQKLPLSTTENGLNIIWVGRYLERPNKYRNITHLIDVARRNEHSVNVRLIGTGMERVRFIEGLPKNVQVFGEVFDEQELENHFSWSHLVMSPGHIGLLVNNAARFGRPVVIDSTTDHAPEIQLAIDANQLFLDFDNHEKVDQLIKSLINDNGEQLEKWSKKIVKVMKEKYNLEYMVSQSLEAING